MVKFDSQAWWQTFIGKNEPLAIMTDLDGTLMPFANSPEEARPDAEVIDILTRLTQVPDIMVTIVSGRKRDYLDAHFSDIPKLHLVAEHGVWRRANGNWQTSMQLPISATNHLADLLEATTSRFPGALVERKTWSVALHFRRVAASLRSALLVEAAAFAGTWLAAHEDFEVLTGEQMLEFRPKVARKSNAVNWLCEELRFPGRLLAFGDDVTDEDLFTALRPADQGVFVGKHRDRCTAAQWHLESPRRVLDFYAAVIGLRQGEKLFSASTWPLPISDSAQVDTVKHQQKHDLLVVSNRLPDFRGADLPKDGRTRNVGGLVSALDPVLASRRGMWLGWNGRTHAQGQAVDFGYCAQGQPAWAWMSLSKAWYRDYYKGFCNSTLWPLFHSFPSRARFRRQEWDSYCDVNAAFSDQVHRLVEPQTVVWVHDYHLLLAAKYLRKAKHTGPIGFFLHIPFPGPDMFFLMPSAETVLKSLLSYDLLGFHTQAYADNFVHCLNRAHLITVVDGNVIVAATRRIRIGVFPLGIIPESFQEASDPEVAAEIGRLLDALSGQKMILGVDRLDYTKGIPERLEAFGHLLRTHPQWRRQVSLVQVSVPSRADIPEYEEQRTRIEESVGRINGEFGEADWVPIRYLYRSYGRNQLQQLYRMADVGYVTPLRDGMNLVAKEYIAAQDPAKPGVLVLSRFTGAAAELQEAVLTNPWDQEGMSEDLHTALSMPEEERLHRYRPLIAKVQATTALSWAEDFLTALNEHTQGSRNLTMNRAKTLACSSDRYANIVTELLNAVRC